MTETRETPFQCGWCGTNQHEARKLILGPPGCICDSCIGLMVDIIREEVDPEFMKTPVPIPLTTMPNKIEEEIREILEETAQRCIESMGIPEELLSENES